MHPVAAPLENAASLGIVVPAASEVPSAATGVSLAVAHRAARGKAGIGPVALCGATAAALLAVAGARVCYRGRGRR
jgi:hypothetical protein